MKTYTIVLIPLCKIEETTLLEIKNHIEKVYGLETKIAFFEKDLKYNNKKNQYLAECILEEVQKNKISDNEKWVLIVDIDLYHNSNFVLGLAYPNSGVSVISLLRLKQGAENEKLFLERLKKIVTHELGHLFYLDDCHSKRCVMQCSCPIDEKELFLCMSCKRFLQYRLRGYKYSLLLYTLWHA